MVLGLSTSIVYADSSNVLHLSVGLSGNLISTRTWLIPSFDLKVSVNGVETIHNVTPAQFETCVYSKNGESISGGTEYSNEYSWDWGSDYNLEIPLSQPLKSGDVVTLELLNAYDFYNDKHSQMITGIGISGQGSVGYNTPTSITISEYEPYLDAGYSLIGSSKENPIVCTLTADAGYNYLVVCRLPYNYLPAANAELLIKSASEDKSVICTTNDKGLALVDLTSIINQETGNASFNIYAKDGSGWKVTSNTFDLVEYKYSQGGLAYQQIYAFNRKLSRETNLNECIEAYKGTSNWSYLDGKTRISLLRAIGDSKLKLNIDSIDVFVNSSIVDFSKYDNVLPIIENGRTLVPLRAVAETLGASVDYNNDSGIITISNDATIITMQPNNTVITVNGVSSELDVAPKVVNGRTILPIRVIAEALNMYVSWDSYSKTITIDKI